MKFGTKCRNFWLLTRLSPLVYLSFFLFSSLPAAHGDAATVARLQADVQALTANASRAPGTPGNAAAAAYVEKRFKEIGLKPFKGKYSEEFRMTAPVTKGGRATLQIGAQSIGLLPLYPNHVAPSSTPPGGLRG